MYYIEHGSPNFSVIDCRLVAGETMEPIIEEIQEKSRHKNIIRLISTHPDDDHIKGIIELDDAVGLAVDLWTVDVMTAGKSGIEPVELCVGPRHACVHVANVPVIRQHLYEHVTRRAAGKFDRDPWVVLSELNNISVGSGRRYDRDRPSVGATC
jgi:hypothetical protein